MTWVELLAGFLVAHLVGDFFLQTEWQAVNKAGGLGRRPRARRALGAHLLSYAAAMAPALIWVGTQHGVVTALAALAAIVVPHAIQDDRRLLATYARRVKRTDPDAEPLVMFGLDQSGHVLALFLLAIAVA